jgi:hypothetical protein
MAVEANTNHYTTNLVHLSIYTQNETVNILCVFTQLLLTLGAFIWSMKFGILESGVELHVFKI